MQSFRSGSVLVLSGLVMGSLMGIIAGLAFATMPKAKTEPSEVAMIPVTSHLDDAEVNADWKVPGKVLDPITVVLSGGKDADLVFDKIMGMARKTPDVQVLNVVRSPAGKLPGDRPHIGFVLAGPYGPITTELHRMRNDGLNVGLWFKPTMEDRDPTLHLLMKGRYGS